MSALHQGKCRSEWSNRPKCSSKGEKKTLWRVTQQVVRIRRIAQEELQRSGEAAANKQEQVGKVTGGGQILSLVHHPERLQLPPEVAVWNSCPFNPIFNILLQRHETWQEIVTRNFGEIRLITFFFQPTLVGENGCKIIWEFTAEADEIFVFYVYLMEIKQPVLYYGMQNTHSSVTCWFYIISILCCLM